MIPFRVIFTGSRDYTELVLVERTVETLLDECRRHGKKLIVVHGACPTGADHFAHAFATELKAQGHPIDVEAHPADFDKLGPSAGPRRNAVMARSGAHLCVAFCHRLTRGTASMVGLASEHQIPVIIIKPSLPLAVVLGAVVRAAA